jgi:hypothetical protein
MVLVENINGLIIYTKNFYMAKLLQTRQKKNALKNIYKTKTKN